MTVLYTEHVKNQAELSVVSSCILALSAVTFNRLLGRGGGGGGGCRSDGQPIATTNKRKQTAPITGVLCGSKFDS